MSSTEMAEGLIGPDDPEFEDHDRGHGGGHGKDDPPDPARRNIIVTVYAPIEPDPKRFRFVLTTLVGDAARTAATAFGYDDSVTPSFSTPDGTILDRTVTLKAAGVEHKDVLELVDIGGGV